MYFQHKPEFEVEKCRPMNEWEHAKPMMFQYKLWDIMQNRESKAIFWSPKGNSIVINKELFSQEFLGKKKFFKTKSVSSFIRQLYFYGFRKNREPDNVTFNPEEFMEFQNKNFQPGRIDLLANIEKVLIVGKPPIKNSSKFRTRSEYKSKTEKKYYNSFTPYVVGNPRLYIRPVASNSTFSQSHYNPELTVEIEDDNSFKSKIPENFCTEFAKVKQAMKSQDFLQPYSITDGTVERDDTNLFKPSHIDEFSYTESLDVSQPMDSFNLDNSELKAEKDDTDLFFLKAAEDQRFHSELDHSKPPSDSCNFLQPFSSFEDKNGRENDNLLKQSMFEGNSKLIDAKKFTACYSFSSRGEIYLDCFCNNHGCKHTLDFVLPVINGCPVAQKCADNEHFLDTSDDYQLLEL